MHPGSLATVNDTGSRASVRSQTCHSAVICSGSCDRGSARDHAEDSLAKFLGLEELGKAILRVAPRRRDEEDDCFATIHRTGQGRHPALARVNAAVVVDVEKVVAPAVGVKPARKASAAALLALEWLMKMRDMGWIAHSVLSSTQRNGRKKTTSSCWRVSAPRYFVMGTAVRSAR